LIAVVMFLLDFKYPVDIYIYEINNTKHVDRVLWFFKTIFAMFQCFTLTAFTMPFFTGVWPEDFSENNLHINWICHYLSFAASTSTSERVRSLE